MVTDDDLFAFLSSHKLGVLSTTGPTGTPQSALMGIAVTPRLELVFDTVKNSRKYSNLVERPHCSLVVGGWDSREITVQYEGHAEELHAPELMTYQEIYFQAWPDGPARQSWPWIVYFVVRPHWIRYSDFDARPAEIQEFSFGAGV